GGGLPAAEPAATGRATTAAVRHPLGGAARAGALARRARRGPRRYRRGARGRGGPVGPRPRRRPPAAAHPRLAAERGPPLPADLRGLLRHVPRRGPARDRKST